MASGLLGKAALPAGSDTVIYTAPAGSVTTATVSICNTTAGAITASLAVGTGNAAAAGDYLVFGLTIPINSTYERTGIVLSAGENIIVRSNVAGPSARAHGFEESI